MTEHSDDIDAVAEIEKAQSSRGAFADSGKRRRGPRGTRMFIIATVLGAVAVLGLIGYLSYVMSQRHEKSAKAEKAKVERLTPTKENEWQPVPAASVDAPAVASTVAAGDGDTAAVKVGTKNAASGDAAGAVGLHGGSHDTTPSGFGPTNGGGQQAASGAITVDTITSRRLGGSLSDDKDEAQPAAPGQDTVSKTKSMLEALKGDQGQASLGGSEGSDKPAQAQGLEDKLKPLKLQPSVAGYVANRNFLVTSGAKIDCGTVEKLDTTVPGMVSCITTRPLWSDNMRVILVDAGSKVTGFIQQAPAQGQARVFVTWQRIQTPQGVFIEVNSPTSDSDGAGGIAGTVNTHFWARFGGGITISLISDLGQSLAASANNNNSNINLNTTSSTTESLVGEVLKNTVNIPPTLTANKARRVTIDVIRDMDFSGVYELKR